MDIKYVIKEYWNKRAETFDRLPGHVSSPNEWRKLLSRIFPEKMKILDVGTGTGFLAMRLAELGHEVTGIDISENMIEIAKKKAQKANLQIKFIVGDAESLPFRDEKFDGVICRHVLWTLPNPEKALLEFLRVTKSGGKIVIIEGNWKQPKGIKKAIRTVATLIYERRKPTNLPPWIYEKLPLRRGKVPDSVVKALRNLGIENITVEDLSWLREIQRKEFPFLYRLVWSNYEYYLIQVVKEG
ncbi:hypothetical protein A3L04_02975 [Thermococcus chitonophagus]|uniref:Methyltransferase MA1848 n=1 Tax=Thermococcus chitonophagus TaxID=54262 RepID=A0A161KB29_9EURY|nr:class I SAM-dependent methyltransferase [Thermococcus chitonophagus]ASJ16112.1 hypothetical protein A3L04_02975 [Thermococcus chitonophagus]CUX78920.1 Methyltransferase MA1848 [Thermococcus chitonophagus]